MYLKTSSRVAAQETGVLCNVQITQGHVCLRLYLLTRGASLSCNALSFSCMGTPLSVSATFAKGNNFYDFLFAFLEDEALSKKGSTLKRENLLLGEQVLS